MHNLNLSCVHYLKTDRTDMVNEKYARITSRAFSLDHIFRIESHSVNP